MNDLRLHLGQFSVEAERLVEAARSGAPAALKRFRRNFPHRQPTESERSHPDWEWSIEGARLVIAREQGCASWGSLMGITLSTLSQQVSRFRSLVFGGDAEELARLIEEHDSELAPLLDAPLFHFDSPAVVQQKNNREILEVLLAAGADINAKSDWWAGGFCVLDDVGEEQARWLLDRGAVAHAGVFAHLGWKDELHALLEQDSDAVHRRFGDGKRALHWASSVEVAELLLDGGADIDARCLDHGSTAIQYLLGQGSEVPRLLAQRGAEVDVFTAAALGDSGMLSRLLARDPHMTKYRIGRTPFARVSDDWGGTAYQWSLGFDLSPHEVARRFGHHDVYQQLMELSAPSVQLLVATLVDDSDWLEEIEGIDAIVAGLSQADLDLFPIAAWNGELAAVQRFVDLGFDLHRPGPEDSTPLDRAAFRGWAEIVELLLENDDEPPLERKNRFGGTPLSACVHGARVAAHPRADHLRTASALIAAGAKFEADWLPTGHHGMDQLLAEALA